jgi:hypothetical protein
MRFARTAFLIAGVYGVVLITPMYFMEERIGRESPPAITHPDYYYGFLGGTLAWQVLFLILASDPLRYRPMILPAIIEKVSYTTAMIFLAFKHRISPMVLTLSSIDSILALLFVVSYITIGHDMRNNRRVNDCGTDD